MEKIQKIVATGFISNNEKVLIIERSKNEKFLPGYWELPGGKINFGEDPKIALERECQEEIGTVITVANPFRTFSYVSDDENCHTVEIVYKCEYPANSNIKLSSAHADFKWIIMNELDNYNISDETKTSIKEGFDKL